jgi:hypothetical protein
MPESELEIRVSHREWERGHDLKAIASRNGEPVEGMTFRLLIDIDGTFNDESEVTELELVTKLYGYAFMTWWEWPRSGPRRDITSVIKAVWDDPDVYIFLDFDEG